MADIDPDSVYLIKKNIGYARFFLKVGKRSDAQERLRKALLIIEEASRGMFTATNETHQFMDFTEEIRALWKESKETPDPPGSSFVLAMGDMVYLATPGGGMSIVNIDPEKKSVETGKTNPTPGTPRTPPVPVTTAEKNKPQGFFDRFRRPFGGGGDNDDKEEETRKQQEQEEISKRREEEQTKSEPLNLHNKDFSSVVLTEDQKKNRTESMIIVDGRSPVKTAIADPMNPHHLSYTLVHIGTDETQRQGVFFEALRQLKREGTGSQSNNTRVGEEMLPYYSQYFDNACARPRGERSVDPEHPKKFVKYVLGQEGTLTNQVEKFNLMMLETAPAVGKNVNNDVYQDGSRKVVSFAFMKIGEDLDTMRVELVCHTKKDKMGGGVGVMKKIEDIGKIYGVYRIALNSVLPVLGFYYKLGYETPTKGFNEIMVKVFDMAKKSVPEKVPHKRLAVVLKEDFDIMETEKKQYDEEDALRMVEFLNNPVYTRYVAASILSSINERGTLVHAVRGFLDADNDSSANGLETKLRELVTSVATEIDSDTYTTDENGEPEINMAKYI